jgi:hypothetical protein
MSSTTGSSDFDERWIIMESTSMNKTSVITISSSIGLKSLFINPYIGGILRSGWFFEVVVVSEKIHFLYWVANLDDLHGEGQLC